MKNSKRSIGAMVGGLILISVTLAVGGDWTQWRGADRDGVVTGFTAPKSWPVELAEKWRVTVGKGDATPALKGDRLFVFARQGADEVIMCLDAASGKELWRDKYAAQEVTGPAARQPCFAIHSAILMKKRSMWSAQRDTWPRSRPSAAAAIFRKTFSRWRASPFMKA